MKIEDYSIKARSYMTTLCNVTPNRRTGSVGNRQATDFFQHMILPFGYLIDATAFPCVDYDRGEVFLTHGPTSFEVFISPYSPACDVNASLVSASTVDELEKIDCEGRILLMRGDLCSEQLMPKNFVFYNPENHQRIIALLEEKNPAVIITATGKNPDLVGALDPFPLIADGDFNIPNIYCRETVGDVLDTLQGEKFHLKVDTRRIASSATNVIARLNKDSTNKIVFTAHIDAYEDSLGALDNASGTAVLLLLAEMLSDFRDQLGIEIIALNGEDHYSAAGQMDYLRRYGEDFPNILLAVNVDDVGYRHGKSSYSFYECTEELQEKVSVAFRPYDGLMRGDPWFNGDHMIFVQGGVPSLAITSERVAELMSTVTHTSQDTPELIDYKKLVEVAQALNTLIRCL